MSKIQIMLAAAVGLGAVVYAASKVIKVIEAMKDDFDCAGCDDPEICNDCEYRSCCADCHSDDDAADGDDDWSDYEDDWDGDDDSECCDDPGCCKYCKFRAKPRKNFGKELLKAMKALNAESKHEKHAADSDKKPAEDSKCESGENP